MMYFPTRGSKDKELSKQIEDDNNQFCNFTHLTASLSVFVNFEHK